MDLLRRRSACCTRLASLLLCFAAAELSAAGASAAPPLRPFPQHMSYAPGSIRPDHRSQTEQDDDVRAL